ncbi:LacI family DNA-binding transcriptional regulator [Lactobacillus sp. CC-MHH1034]|uniref:LacI family DNA-binding transcriptional regulator n=1 Tax=Agrilactobacillus fermenti TaxID=2586909 RepID=UPI001E2E3DEA|nr:LacI family DNA-binding transcriptional regulator [Agrilactobacillus fermenti]MCD2256059.1 LacI family DNA-binding transcriptional regulator [Agrilactobacillus fermenti]
MVTIKTIAKLANVSNTTVSRALNNSPRITPETKTKILKIANELGYEPNLNARSLVTNKSYTVGLFFSNITSGTSRSFLTEAINAFYKYLSHSYTLSINAINDLPNFESINHRFDGICIISQSTDDDAFINYVTSQRIPVVVLNRRVSMTNVPNVYFDEYLAARQIAEYGVKLGHKRFGLIQGICNFASSVNRQRGYIETLKRYDINLGKSLIFPGDYTMQSGYRAMKQILLMQEPPTFVFASNDDMAMGAYKACAELNVHIPDDISIVGFDDSDFSEYLTPALTTVQKPITDMGKIGIQWLSQLMSKEALPEIVCAVPPELMIRNSVKKINY